MDTVSLYAAVPGSPTPSPDQAPYDRPVAFGAPATATATPVLTDGWVQEQTPHPVVVSSPFADRRIVVRLSTGEELVVGTARSSTEAAAIGRDVVRRIADAESAGEWPDFDGHFVRPDTIVSVDVEVAA